MNSRVRIEIFRDYDERKLSREVNDFCRDVDVVNVSYSNQKIGYEVCHYVCVAYKNI